MNIKTILFLILLLSTFTYSNEFVTIENTNSIDYNNNNDYECNNCLKSNGEPLENYINWFFVGDNSHNLRHNDKLELKVNSLDGYFYYISDILFDDIEIEINNKKITPLNSDFVIFKKNDEHYIYSFKGYFYYGDTLIEPNILININKDQYTQAIISPLDLTNYITALNAFKNNDMSLIQAFTFYEYDIKLESLKIQNTESDRIEYEDIFNNYIYNLLYIKNKNEKSELKINDINTFNDYFETFEDYLNIPVLSCKKNINNQLSLENYYLSIEYLDGCLDNYLIYDPITKSDEFEHQSTIAFDGNSGTFYLSNDEQFKANKPFDMDKYFVQIPGYILFVEEDIEINSNYYRTKITTNNQAHIYDGYDEESKYNLKNGEKLIIYFNDENGFNEVLLTDDKNYIIQNNKNIEFSKGNTAKEIIELMGLSVTGKIKFNYDYGAFEIFDDTRLYVEYYDYITPPLIKEGKLITKPSKIITNNLKPLITGEFSTEVNREEDDFLIKVEKISYNYFGGLIDKLPFDRKVNFYIFAFIVLYIVFRLLRR